MSDVIGLGKEYGVFKEQVKLGSDWRGPGVTHLENSPYSSKVEIEIKRKTKGWGRCVCAHFAIKSAFVNYFYSTNVY